MQRSACFTQIKARNSTEWTTVQEHQLSSKIIHPSTHKKNDFISFETQLMPTFHNISTSPGVTKLTLHVDNGNYKNDIFNKRKNALPILSNEDDGFFLKEKTVAGACLMSCQLLNNQKNELFLHSCFGTTQQFSSGLDLQNHATNTNFESEPNSHCLTQCEVSSIAKIHTDFSMKDLTKDIRKLDISITSGNKPYESNSNEQRTQIVNEFSFCDGLGGFDSNNFNFEDQNFRIDESENNEVYQYLQSPLCCPVIEASTAKESSMEYQPHLTQLLCNDSDSLISEPLNCDSSEFYADIPFNSNGALVDLLKEFDYNHLTQILPNVQNGYITGKATETSQENRNESLLDSPDQLKPKFNFNDQSAEDWLACEQNNTGMMCIKASVENNPFRLRNEFMQKNHSITENERSIHVKSGRGIPSADSLDITTEQNNFDAEGYKPQMSNTLIAFLESCCEIVQTPTAYGDVPANPKNCVNIWNDYGGDHPCSTADLYRLASTSNINVNSELLLGSSGKNHLKNEETIQFTCCFDGESVDYEKIPQSKSLYPINQQISRSVTTLDSKTKNFSTFNEIINELNSCDKRSTSKRVTDVAKRQSGSRYLQQLLTQNTNLLIPSIILSKMLESLHELMIDPYGNYLCQRLFESCSSVQRQQIIVTLSPRIKAVACHHIGTYSMQALVSLIAKSPQEHILMLVLESHLPGLIVHPHATYIIQKILKCFSESSTDIIFMKVLKNLQSYAVDAHGLCVVKCCITSSAQRTTYCHRYLLSQRLTPLTLTLVQSHFGNYAIQHAFETWGRETCSGILEQIKNHVIELSTQKFSSNVVEKAIEIADTSYVEQIVKTFTHPANMTVLMNSVYGRFVFQKLVTRASIESIHSLLMVATAVKHSIPKENRARHKWNKAFEMARKRLQYNSTNFDTEQRLPM